MKINKLKLSSNFVRIITGAVILITGLILLIKPETSLVTVCYIFGVIAAIKGIVKIAECKRNDNNKAMFPGIVLLVIAFLLLLHPKFLISLFPVMIGLSVLGYGIYSLLSNKTLLSKILGVITILAGVGVIVVPLKFASAITAVIGFALVLTGILLIIAEFLIKRKINSPYLTDTYTEVDFTDVDD